MAPGPRTGSPDGQQDVGRHRVPGNAGMVGVRRDAHGAHRHDGFAGWIFGRGGAGRAPSQVDPRNLPSSARI